MVNIKMKGIDVSYWQGKPAGYRYRKFKAAGWDFIIARIGYADGISYCPDSTFEHNFKMCKRYGIKFGIYFYSNARNAAQGRAEAQYVLKLLKKRRIDLPIYIDMEDNATSGRASKSSLASACKAFCNTIENAGYKSGVYASTSWFQSKIGNLGGLSKWVAQYNDRVTYGGSYDMWQYSSTDTVPGFSGIRDCNKAYTLFDGKKPVRKKYAGTFPKLPKRGYFKSGDRGTQVKYLQSLLNWLTGSGLAVDGIVGQRTINAVYAFQEDVGLYEDGLFGKNCLAKSKEVKR